MSFAAAGLHKSQWHSHLRCCPCSLCSCFIHTGDWISLLCTRRPQSHSLPHFYLRKHLPWGFNVPKCSSLPAFLLAAPALGCGRWAAGPEPAWASPDPGYTHTPGVQQSQIMENQRLSKIIQSQGITSGVWAGKTQPLVGLIRENKAQIESQLLIWSAGETSARGSARQIERGNNQNIPAHILWGFLC